jgi:hypothetical protein
MHIIASGRLSSLGFGYSAAIGYVCGVCCFKLRRGKFDFGWR